MELDKARELTLAFGGCWHEWAYHPGGYGPGGGYTAWRTCIHCNMQVFGYVDKTPKNREFVEPDDYFWLMAQISMVEKLRFIEFVKRLRDTNWVEWEMKSPEVRCTFIYDWWKQTGRRES